MAAVPSTMMPLGTNAPAFSLPDSVTGKLFSLPEPNESKGTLVMFICNHCKYVKHIHSELVKVCNNFVSNGGAVLAISSNDVVNYPEDDPTLMKLLAQSSGYTFPYLYDESQAIAKAYDAACTPDLFLFNKDLKLVYRGQFDGARPSTETEVTGADLQEAIEALLNGQPINEKQIPSIGCNIKWKA